MIAHPLTYHLAYQVQSQFATRGATGVVPLNLISLWTWDACQSNWMFYAPALENNNTLNTYIQSKGYFKFDGFDNHILAPGSGFWVNVSWP